MKQSKWKEILTSNQMFIVYIIVVLCIAISMKTPAFAEVSTIITLARALLVTLCFAICEMVLLFREVSMFLSRQLRVHLFIFQSVYLKRTILTMQFLRLYCGSYRAGDWYYQCGTDFIASDSAVDCYAWCEQYYTGHASYILWHQTDLKTAKYD